MGSHICVWPNQDAWLFSTFVYGSVFCLPLPTGPRLVGFDNPLNRVVAEKINEGLGIDGGVYLKIANNPSGRSVSGFRVARRA